MVGTSQVGRKADMPPHCGGGSGNVSITKGKKCTCWHKSCRKYFTVRTGTNTHGSNTGIKWVVAIYKGISSLQLSKELGVTQKTAWFILQCGREPCRQNVFKLSGQIEIDETYIGDEEANKHKSKKGCSRKNCYAGHAGARRQIKAMPPANIKQTTLQGEIVQNVEMGSYLFADDHWGCAGSGDVSYNLSLIHI